MHILKRITALLMVLVILLSIPVNVRAEGESGDELIRKILNYFQYYQWDAQTDYELLLDQMARQDPQLANTWSGILDFWIRLNRDMDVHQPVLPDGLPEDDSLCIAVLGYYLKPDGKMRDELYERLYVALESAQKYPNSYILCTGGSTASENRKVSEASQMAKWLIKKGIAEERIIVEEQAYSTIENAQYGCKLLYRDYPQVKALAVITSDYHIYRGSLYFNTQAALDAHDLGVEPMTVLAAATCRIKPNAPSDIDTQVEGMSILTDLDVEDMEKPKLSTLTGIEVSGTTQYELGDDLDLTVSEVYSSGYSREVTQGITYSGFDFNQSGVQTVTATYRNGDIVETASIDIEIIIPAGATVPSVPLPTEEPVVEQVYEETEPAPDIAAATEEESPGLDLHTSLIIAAVCVLLLIVLLYLKHRQAKKRRRRRRPRPVIKLD